MSEKLSHVPACSDPVSVDPPASGLLTTVLQSTGQLLWVSPGLHWPSPHAVMEAHTDEPQSNRALMWLSAFAVAVAHDPAQAVKSLLEVQLLMQMKAFAHVGSALHALHWLGQWDFMHAKAAGQACATVITSVGCAAGSLQLVDVIVPMVDSAHVSPVGQSCNMVQTPLLQVIRETTPFCVLQPWVPDVVQFVPTGLLATPPPPGRFAPQPYPSMTTKHPRGNRICCSVTSKPAGGRNSKHVPCQKFPPTFTLRRRPDPPDHAA